MLFYIWRLATSICLISAREVQEDDVTFYLITQNNRGNYTQVFSENVTVDYNKEIIFIIHGRNEDRSVPWYDGLKNAFLAQQSNIIIQVDWARVASQFYPIAVLDVDDVGQIVAQFIAQLVNNQNVDIKNVHICGHSLGAHVAGFAGKYLTELGLKVARITALDPARPFFEDFFVLSEGLSKHDADIVVVVHTDRGKWGVWLSYGAIDLFPNGGGAPQPGCPDPNNLLTCSHARSHQFFINALENRGTLVATQCQSYQLYIEGRCYRGRQLDLAGNFQMGDEGDYYFTTNTIKPYGQGPKCAIVVYNEITN